MKHLVLRERWPIHYNLWVEVNLVCSRLFSSISGLDCVWKINKNLFMRHGVRNNSGHLHVKTIKFIVHLQRHPKRWMLMELSYFWHHWHQAGLFQQNCHNKLWYSSSVGKDACHNLEQFRWEINDILKTDNLESIKGYLISYKDLHLPTGLTKVFSSKFSNSYWRGKTFEEGWRFFFSLMEHQPSWVTRCQILPLAM